MRNWFVQDVFMWGDVLFIPRLQVSPVWRVRRMDMAIAMDFRTMVEGSLRSAVSGVLCVLMVGQPMVAAAKVKRTASVPQIQGEERALHALNRFTFGPRPGDLAAVQAMGVRQWFERQLNPLSIDDSALDERLAAFPAMQM